MESPARRRELGAFYTPPDVAARLVAIALEGAGGEPLVCDPACGDGAFLLAAADALAARGIPRDAIATHLLWGIDVDPAAVDATRGHIERWAGVAPGDHVRVGDGLDAVDWCGRFDVVVGNPPFLNQLELATARRGPPRWPGLGPYADSAFLFLLAGLDLVREGGRVLLIQPQSIAATRDGRAVRERVRAAGAVLGMWTCDEHVFDASVRVCAPFVERRARQPAAVARWEGRDVAPVAPAPWNDAPTWSRLLVVRDEPPAVHLGGARSVGEMATATAGFRDQFYGLAPFVVDEQRGSLPKLVTCGAIDPGRCTWGERPLRFSGRNWRHPRVDVASVEGPLRRWLDERLVPKVVVATQTKVIEAAVDVDGSWVPSTPVIAVHADPDDLFSVAAALHAPPAAAWAAATFAGTALTAEAIKLSARQVLAVPLPEEGRAWREAAVALAAGDVVLAARRMNDAHGCTTDVFTWWSNRARLP